jgi:hypothetical protein
MGNIGRAPLAIALAGCALCPGAALAAASARLHVALAPNRLGARTTIELSLRIAGPHGSPPQSAALIERGLEGCSVNARLGFGEAVGVVATPAQRVVERGSLTALMGPPTLNQVEVLFYVEGLSPVFAQLVFRIVVRPFLTFTSPEIPAALMSRCMRRRETWMPWPRRSSACTRRDP